MFGRRPPPVGVARSCAGVLDRFCHLVGSRKVIPSAFARRGRSSATTARARTRRRFHRRLDERRAPLGCLARRVSAPWRGEPLAPERAQAQSLRRVRGGRGRGGDPLSMDAPSSELDNDTRTSIHLRGHQDASARSSSSALRPHVPRVLVRLRVRDLRPARPRRRPRVPSPRHRGPARVGCAQRRARARALPGEVGQDGPATDGARSRPSPSLARFPPFASRRRRPDGLGSG